ncbi:hypothetical protein LMG29542_07497 [Paraburkholderia humisilvae]|uniref:Uncharacterized protein n=1 Tax=Paraburkholderia humisilvae TaxID=627669 RepID=A0A6J5F5V6_9BURK|nr:hypothetical protein LMG29542_07497 [Paraburkholderia humisilvae]
MVNLFILSGHHRRVILTISQPDINDQNQGAQRPVRRSA